MPPDFDSDSDGDDSSGRVWRAPAKINLGLRILGRRPDGYHLLESVFLPLELADEIELRVHPARESRVELVTDAVPGLVGGDQLGPPEGNLASRAARRYLEAADATAHVGIRLRKQIPIGAGLGGGSSDAAAVLRALAALSPGRRVPSGELARLALELGADVPFFLDPRPSLVSGIGEQIEPLSGLPAIWLVLLNPRVSLATADVYAAFDASEGALTPVSPGSTMRALSGLRSGATPLAEPTAQFLDPVVTNDLEPPACRLCPDVARLRERLLDVGAVAAAMSGSGATVYGVFPDERSARFAREQVVAADADSSPKSEAGAAERSSDDRAPIWAQVVRSIGSDSGDP